MLVEKYQYPSLRRVTIDKNRHYASDQGEPVPSVTTVLSKTGDKSGLIAWRERVGEAEAQRISTESANLGTKVHNSLEKYILGEHWEITGSNMISQIAARMTHKMISEGFHKVDELWGTEVGLLAEGLYAGTADGVGVFDGEPSIVDFKTAKKIKRREWIEDYFLQGAAYSLAHNEMFGTNIRQIAILMVDRDSNFQEFVVKDAEFDHYCEQWANRLMEYNSKYR
jgi:ATP-dependent exoDNAse (exonuclease V) beta subunit